MKSADDVERALLENGYEGTLYLRDPSYAEALIGVDLEGRAVYDFEGMVECLMQEGDTREEAVEFIEYNTIRALPYMGERAPLIVRRVQV